MALASFISRKVFRGQGVFAGDIFIAGATLLPCAVFLLLLALLVSIGKGNIGIKIISGVFVAGVFVVYHTVLILYHGFTKISKVSDGAAAIAIASILSLSVWLTKIMITSLPLEHIYSEVLQPK